MEITESIGTGGAPDFPSYSDTDATFDERDRLLEKGAAVLAVSEPWRRVVPRWFCEELCSFLDLDTSKRGDPTEATTHFRLLATLLMSVKYSDPDQHIAIPFERVAECAGMAWDLRNRNYLREENATGEILRRFLDTVLPEVKVLEHDHRKGLARELVGVPEALPDKLMEMRVKALKPNTEGKRVYFDYPIKSVNSRSRSEAKQRDEEDQEKWVGRALCPPQKRLLEYLCKVGRGKRSKKFVSRDEDLDRAYRLATGPAKSIDARISALDQVAAIDYDPVPRYKPSYLGNTVRVFTSGYSYCTINRKLRRTLKPNWIELDLASAQLAIVAHDWGLTEVEQFLRTEKSIWRSLYGFMEWEDYQTGVPLEVTKPALKKGLYAGIFGAGKDTILREMYSTFLEEAYEVGFVASPDFLSRIFLHPLIKQLLGERENQIDEIEAEEEATDAFGRKIKISSDTDARSILAQLAQSKELELLLPGLDIAERERRRAEENNGSPRFWIVLWQHDGFSLHVRDKSRRASIVQRFKDAVNGATGPYQTELEVNYPTGEFGD